MEMSGEGGAPPAEAAAEVTKKAPGQQFLTPEKVYLNFHCKPHTHTHTTQADEVAQSEFQKKYGFVKKPVTPRKISSVSVGRSCGDLWGHTLSSGRQAVL